MSVMVSSVGGTSKAEVPYYLFSSWAERDTLGLSGNVVSITGSNSDITNKQKDFGMSWTEYNITAVNTITVQLSEPVKATKLIYEARAQNSGSRRFDYCYLDGSNDGSNWTRLVYVTIGQDASHSSSPHVVSLTTTGKFKYYRYTVSTNNYIYFRHPFDLYV